MTLFFLSRNPQESAHYIGHDSLLLAGCGTSRTTVRPEIYGQFEKTGPIILDTVTGLEWQVGPNRDMTWDEAKAWVDSLSGSWRMPTRGELLGLWNVNIRHRNWGPFENDRLWVWSGAVRDSSSVWAIGFRTGSQYCADRSSFSSNVLAFAVRSLSETPVSYERFEKAGPIIRDTVTGLEWQVGPDRDMTWDEAKAWVDGLRGNWRMPTSDELQGLWDAGINMDNWGPFEKFGEVVWLGEVRDSSSAWVFGFGYGGGGEYWIALRSAGNYARAFAVRSRSDTVHANATEEQNETVTPGNDGFEFNGLYWKVGPDEDTNWYEAKVWVDGLGENWRMPTRAELRGLWDAGINTGNWGPFENSGAVVWSGELYGHDSPSAWYFTFYGGYEEKYYRSNRNANRVFAVRPR